jgi:hypothetical protein
MTIKDVDEYLKLFDGIYESISELVSRYVDQ